ncbi:hypothetical protein FS837_000449 [Tulasnella sp. UAMH 9824]|nr:hypothetical protein FS837_000449 [Tulasnella sp. UAMH 9824]
MSTTSGAESRAAAAQAVDEVFEKLKSFEVDHRRIVFLEDGDRQEGGFGVVRPAHLHASTYLPSRLASGIYGPPQLVAVKQMKLSKMFTSLRKKRPLAREMLVWATLPDHPGIAKFLGFYADFNGSEAWLLSPWEPNGNVSQFIKAHNLSAPEKVSLGNVLVTSEYRVRLCDFGLAQLHGDSGFQALETSTGPKSSIRWSSPELVNQGLRSPASDVYAWAWLVWEIMTGETPRKEAKTEGAVMLEITNSPVPQLDGAVRLRDYPQLWDLMMGCWNADPPLRPTARVCKFTVSYLSRSTISVHGSKSREPQTSNNAQVEKSARECNVL